MFRYVSQPAQILKSYYTGIGRTGVIFVSAFFVATAIGNLNLGLIFFVREKFNSSPFEIGALAGLWALLYVLGCVLLRPLFDRFLPRYVIAGSALGMFVLACGIACSSRLGPIFFLMGAYGLVLSLFWPPLMVWLSADVEGARLGRLVSRYNLSWCLGNIISPYLCGWLAERNTALPLQVGAGLFLITALFVGGSAFILPRTDTLRLNTTATGTNDNNAVCSGTFVRFPAWIGLFASFFGMGVLASIFPVIAGDDLLYSERSIGVLFLVRGGANALTFVLLGRLVFWHFRKVPMLLGQLLGAGVFLGLIYTGSFYLQAILFACFGVSGAISYTESLFHGTSGSRNRARSMGIHESVLSFGLASGSVAAGVIYMRTDAATLYRTCAMIILVLAGVQLWMFRANHRSSCVRKDEKA